MFWEAEVLPTSISSSLPHIKRAPYVPFHLRLQGAHRSNAHMELQGKYRDTQRLHQVGGACSLTAVFCPSKAVL